MPQGYLRRLSRPQAQQEISFQQRSFGGGQNSDSVPTKIGSADVALSVNTVHTSEDIQGGWGRKLLSPRAIPGSGRLHSVGQHPATGRWIVHRGEKIWVSSGRNGSGWQEASRIGPDGALSASGDVGKVVVDVDGEAASVISAMILDGVTVGDTVYVSVNNDLGAYSVGVYSDVARINLIAAGAISSSTAAPFVLNLSEQGGSGVSGSVVFGIDPGGLKEGAGTAVLQSGARAVTYSGDAFDYISNLVVYGYYGSAALTLTIAEGTGGDFVIDISLGAGDPLCSFTANAGDQPITGATIAAETGMGVYATCDIDGIPNSGYSSYTGTISNTLTQYEIDFFLRGLTEENTDGFSLFPSFSQGDARLQTYRVYKDSARSALVSDSNPTIASNDTVILSGENESGIVGYAEPVVPLLFGGGYVVSDLSFDADSVASIDADSTVSFFRESGFILHVRGASPRTVYVEQNINKYWFLSERGGYGLDEILGSGSGVYQYRYLYTLSRIVDPETYLPDYSADRDSGVLQFEGPSNKSEVDETDYSVMSAAAPVSVSDPVNLSLINASGSLPVAINASAYITHISIYRTLDVGLNGVGPNGAGNNTEQYIWVADVPVYLTSYADTADDALLRNRLVGASQEQDSLSLRSRLFTEMPKGIGAVGPDFMFTSAPQGNVAAYCDIAANPRLIGYYFAGSQRWLVNDPITNIYRTNSLFVVVCPSSTYTSIPEVQAETGIAGILPIVTLQNFEPASKTLGVKYGQGVFPVDENSFVSLLSDGTVRVFSGASWGEPLDGEMVHKITELGEPGAVFAFQRKTLLMWMRKSPVDAIFGPGASYLSDLALSNAGADTLYGRIENIGGGDGYVVNLYSDEARSILVSVASWGPNPMDPQTLTFIPESPGGPSGTVFADISSASLPADFTIAVAYSEPVCLRYGVGGPNGNKWTTVERDTWATPPSWCGAMIVEDDDAALRVAVFDEATKAVFAVEDAPPLRQYVDDVVAVYDGGLVGDAATYISDMVLDGATPGAPYSVIISATGPDQVGVYLFENSTLLAEFSGSISAQPIEGAEMASVDGSGISGTFNISGYSGGYADGTFTEPGVVVSGTSEFSPVVRLRELIGRQENFLCIHQESHVAVRPRYGQPALPDGLLFTVRGYESGVANPGATTIAAPVDFDIQFFARLQGKQIQLEYAANKSGWRITSFDTKYQTQDMQSGLGPWNSVESDYQAALASDLVSWLYGSTGLVDRASPVNARYLGDVPASTSGPSGSAGQMFSSPVAREYAASLQDYALMFWTLAPTVGAAPETGAVSYLTASLYAMFSSTSSILVGGVSVDLPRPVTAGNGWQHFAIVREGIVLTVYQNGVSIYSENVIAPPVEVASQIVGCSAGAQDVADIRLYSAAKSAEVISYYYNDVLLNQGKKVLP